MLVMTLNLRFENAIDAENGWQFRRDLVVDLLSREAPALLGTQEGTRSQLSYLEEHLDGYGMHAPDRIWDADCQYPTLFYRRDLLRVGEGGELWLSERPTVHRSKNWDSAFERMMSFGLFEHLETGKVFRAAVTHLDHLGATARREQARIISRWASGLDGSILVLGDFNDSPGSAVHRALCHEDSGLLDSWMALSRPETPEAWTFHNFEGIPRYSRMDWILTSRDWNIVDARIIKEHRNGRYPSDHYPYAVELT